MYNFVFITLLILASYAYAWCLGSLAGMDIPLWQAIALLNGGIALLSWLCWKPKAGPPAPEMHRRIAWAMPPMILLLSLTVALVSRALAGNASSIPLPVALPYSAGELVILCIWIPVMEEIIFRRWIGDWIGRRWDGLAVPYLSGLLFALAHTHPPLDPWPPLGPFVLGMACSWLYRTTGQLTAPILLHAACNASAVVFTTYAPAWLEHLSWLYQKL